MHIAGTSALASEGATVRIYRRLAYEHHNIWWARCVDRMKADVGPNIDLKDVL